MHKPEDKGYKVTTNCELDAETKESLLKHLDEHGPVSLLASNRFSQYAGCFLEEITRAVAAESSLIAPAAVDLTGNQDGAASPADEATESPAAMRARFQSRRRIASYRQGHI